MPDIISDGQTKVLWVTTIATPSAPTSAELTAGVALELLITPDGFNITPTQDMVDTSSLASTQDSEVPGRYKETGDLTFKQQGYTAAPWMTFDDTTPGVRPSGFLVTRIGKPSTTAIAAADKVTVRAVKVGRRNELPATKNEVVKFSMPVAIQQTLQAVAVV